jgi:hypothetical protein
MDVHQHKAMLSALEAGTATPDQQRAAFAHLNAVKRQHQAELREAERDSRDAYFTGQADAASAERGEPFGTY